jgi:hypothetical protein
MTLRATLPIEEFAVAPHHWEAYVDLPMCRNGIARRTLRRRSRQHRPGKRGAGGPIEVGIQFSN